MRVPRSKPACCVSAHGVARSRRWTSFQSRSLHCSPAMKRVLLNPELVIDPLLQSDYASKIFPGCDRICRFMHAFCFPSPKRGIPMLKRDYGGGALEAPTTCGEVENARRLAHTWAARILDLMGRPARNARFNEDAFVELGLVEEKHSDPGVNDVLSDRTRIQALRRELEARDWDGDGQLARNLAFLASCFRLTEPECAVIAFLAICWRFGWLRELVEDASRYSRLGSPANCAAAATGISEQGAYAALSREGRLVQCGLLESKFRTSVDPTDLPHLDDEIRLWIWHPEFGEGFLERQYVRRPVVVDDPEAKTDRMPADLECIRKIVQSMLDGRTAAGQILIHGKAGTGKTRFARQLAESLDADQFEVLESRLGFHLGAVERLRCFRAAQELFRERERCMLVFDEADQVLAGSTGFRSLYSTDWDKAWLNSVLERAVVPGIWIANDIEAVHASTLRRFSMIAEMPDMTESVRSEILRQKIKDLPVGHDWIRQTAKSRSVTPALMERAARVGHALRTAPGEEIEAAMSQTLEGHCRAAGGRFDPPKTAGRNDFDLPYSIDWLNTQPESEPVFDNMTVAREAEGRLL